MAVVVVIVIVVLVETVLTVVEHSVAVVVVFCALDLIWTTSHGNLANLEDCVLMKGKVNKLNQVTKKG